MFKLEDIITLPLKELLEKSNAVCNGFIDSFEACSIINARSGLCLGDCKYCAQSKVSSAEIDVYPLLSYERILEKALYSRSCGAERFSIVTSGESITEYELEQICKIVPRLIQDTGMNICASLGILSKGQLLRLKSAGLSRYHHNIETSERYYREIISSHSFQDRINTVKNAKEAGLEVCCGGIIGMGETWQDRFDMVLTLKELRPSAVPINIFIPIKGTPLADITPISCEEALRAIVLFRMVLQDIDLKLIAGRERIFSDARDKIFKAGINGVMVGGYLTVQGQGRIHDLEVCEIGRSVFS